MTTDSANDPAPMIRTKVMKQERGKKPITLKFCLTCRYWDVTDAHERADCRRYPPQYTTRAEIGAWRYPQMAVQDWCGEFKAVKVKKGTKQ